MNKINKVHTNHVKKHIYIQKNMKRIAMDHYLNKHKLNRKYRGEKKIDKKQINCMQMCDPYKLEIKSKKKQQGISDGKFMLSRPKE